MVPGDAPPHKVTQSQQPPDGSEKACFALACPAVMKIMIFATFLFLGTFARLGHIYADKFYLRDGRMIEGDMSLLARVDERSGAEEHIAKPIAVIDDGLRRIYIAKFQIRLPFSEPIRPETFKTGQSANLEGKEYVIPGTYSNRTPFDMFGRRLLEVRYPGGIEYTEQAIVEVTPYYVRVTSLRADNKPVVWNMRIATNAIPREQLTPILMNLIDPQDIDDRIKLVQFYHAGKLYSSADAELESILQDWKDVPEVQQRYRPLSLTIRQGKYQQILDEIKFRWENGQYQFARAAIAYLEQDEELPERLLVSVRRSLQEFEETDLQCKDIIKAFKELYEQLPQAEKNEKILPIIAAIEQELNYLTLRRLDTFQLYEKNPQLSATEKLAIGITGWYAGADANNSRLAIAVTLPETEQLIHDYLRSGHNVLLRQKVLEELKNLETSRPDLIAGILATMKPPFSDLPEGDPDRPGYYRLTLSNPLVATGSPRALRTPEIRYSVQLPPEYNPYQRYPMVVSLHGPPQTPDTQLDWWTGEWQNGMRMGHAARHGYIVIAPEWNPPETRQQEYDFSIFPHAAVLYSVNDAFRRFSVNTDKVFISGHGIGGTAAWDIALAHPDLWAGAIIFNAVASKYIDTYESAVYHVPLYLVWGEMEGEGVGTRRKWIANAMVLNRYLQTQTRHDDVTAVQYIGRGMESFYEEILHVLDWMKSRQRNAAPLAFKVETMRPWDSFFWWVEMPNLREDMPRNMFDPLDFPAKSAARPVTVESNVYRATNTVSVTTRPKVANIVISLTPDMIDFKSKVTVTVNDKRYSPPNGIIEPDIEVMLEDVRKRGDRLHPFWATLEGR